MKYPSMYSAKEVHSSKWFRRSGWTAIMPSSYENFDPNNPQSAAYGLALARSGSPYGQSGEIPGFNSFMGHDPRQEDHRGDVGVSRAGPGRPRTRG